MSMKEEIRTELITRIIPFWQNLQDTEYGGYYGRMDYNLHIHTQADKGCILNSRILWFFSTASMVLHDSRLLAYAEHAYNFLLEKFLDVEQGGVYWSVHANGSVADTTKHTYNQAFAIYALSAYYRASQNAKALEIARILYQIIENKCKDDNGYREAFTYDWKPVTNEKLSENGIIAARTMNTLLHILEGYAELYEVAGDEYLRESMQNILQLFCNKIYNPAMKRLEVFFDKDYSSLINLDSYGHDIEASWLLDWGAGLLQNVALQKKIVTITDALAEKVYKKAYSSDSIYNECESGIIDKTRVWWVQAEAIVGFINAWEKHPKKEYYLKAAERIWVYIKQHLIDPRASSEWLWDVDDNALPTSRKDIVGPWKCPYHNGRMCFEVLRRL
jgi:cellobiose epimerase